MLSCKKSVTDNFSYCHDANMKCNTMSYLAIMSVQADLAWCRHTEWINEIMFYLDSHLIVTCLTTESLPISVHVRSSVLKGNLFKYIWCSAWQIIDQLRIRPSQPVTGYVIVLYRLYIRVACYVSGHPVTTGDRLCNRPGWASLQNKHIHNILSQLTQLVTLGL